MTAKGEASRNESPHRKRVASRTRGREVRFKPSHTRQGLRSHGFTAAIVGKYVRAGLLRPCAHSRRPPTPAGTEGLSVPAAQAFEAAHAAIEGDLRAKPAGMSLFQFVTDPAR